MYNSYYKTNLRSYTVMWDFAKINDYVLMTLFSNIVPALAENATSETLSQVTCTSPQANVSTQETASICCEGQLPQSSGTLY